MKKFVYVTKDLQLSKQNILKNTVGIIDDNSNSVAKVTFATGVKVKNIPNSYLKEFDINKTGDQNAKKICNVCGRLLPTSLFQKNQNGKGNRQVRRPSCNECREKIDGIPVSSSDKRKWEKIKPNLEIWTCPVCGKTTIPGLTSKVVLDHDHKTGKPRAWICDSCNTGLGRFKDDTELLQNAISYLNKYSNK